ncbi:hypothetical protein ACFSKN_08755 [Mariniflexile gromovii]|uniref:Uncharacterized protein n=1 Tax=Mariniflexile gromovii TaxID=362523 RepID=A0ABS4BXQ7_9FLAO|nr:hypothetical protein [Mariniflexile gromovii]MBP0905364.1 hypothetical protein [Mariniflexile gromovii]
MRKFFIISLGLLFACRNETPFSEADICDTNESSCYGTEEPITEGSGLSAPNKSLNMYQDGERTYINVAFL